MSKIDKNELFQHLSGFLKSKGVELQEGSYTRRVQQGCHLLAETVNRSQDALQRAKGAVDKGLDQVRQAIHEKTAPKPASGNAPSAAAPAPSEPMSKATPRKPKPAKATRVRSRKRRA
jgi:hypothetical protein